MKQLVPTMLISALVGGGAAYFVSNMGESNPQTALETDRARLDLLVGAFQDYLAADEKVGYILINKAAQAGKCLATTTPQISAYAGQRLKWNFNVIDASCLANGERVEIRFKDDPPTYEDRPISAAGKKFIKAKLKDIFLENRYVDYSIWMVPPKGEPYLMEDPELEIIATSRLKQFIAANPLPPLIPEPSAVPSPSPAGNQSPAQPQKKQ